MKTIVTVLILIFNSYISFGQTFSFSIDSITKKHIDQLPQNKKAMFDKILSQRKSVDWFVRIDSTNFDYAFIEETFCFSDKNGQITERYFKKNDSIPEYVYVNGDFHDPKKIYDGFLIWYSKNVTYLKTLYPLIDNFSKLKSTQELAYDKRQIWTHGCVFHANGEKDFENERIKQLKSTYQIQTMIDRTNNTIIVSIQFAPTSPIFETYSYNGVWDW